MILPARIRGGLLSLFSESAVVKDGGGARVRMLGFELVFFSSIVVSWETTCLSMVFFPGDPELDELLVLCKMFGTFDGDDVVAVVVVVDAPELGEDSLVVNGNKLLLGM